MAALADLHYTKTSQGSAQGFLAQIADAADVLLICGDLTDNGLVEEARALASDLKDRTDRWRQKAAETYGHASSTVTDLLSRGREAAVRGREAFQSAREDVESRFPTSTGSGSTGL